MSKPTVSKVVQEFMVQANRPYVLNDVVEKCGKELGKAAIQKSLDSLTEKGILKSKTYGKHKIYYAQQQPGNSGELKKNLQLAKQKLNQAQHTFKTKETQLAELESKLRTKSNLKSLDSLEEEKEQLLDAIRIINEKLRYHEAEEKQAKISSQECKKIESRYDSVATAYRKRKRMCTDMLDAIMEGYPKTKKALIADIGLETDEEVGFAVQLKR